MVERAAPISGWYIHTGGVAFPGRGPDLGGRWHFILGI